MTNPLPANAMPDPQSIAPSVDVDSVVSKEDNSIVDTDGGTMATTGIAESVGLDSGLGSQEGSQVATVSLASMDGTNTVEETMQESSNVGQLSCRTRDNLGGKKEFEASAGRAISRISDQKLRRQLLEAVEHIKKFFYTRGMDDRHCVYILEGIPGVPETEGRPGTDHDEVPASIGAPNIVRATGGASCTIAVPDAANIAQTRKYLEMKVGWACMAIKDVKEGQELGLGLIYLVNMGSQNEIEKLVRLTAANGRRIIGGGPPMGFSYLLLDDDTHNVCFQGKYDRKADGTIDESTKSTNCKGTECDEFLNRMASMPSSRTSMIPVSDLKEESKLLVSFLISHCPGFTEEYAEEWRLQPYQVMLGIAPRQVFFSRLTRGRADKLFLNGTKALSYDTSGKGYIWHRVLQKLSKEPLAPRAALEEAAKTLGEGYGFLLDGADGAIKAGTMLAHLVGPHLIDLETTQRLIDSPVACDPGYSMQMLEHDYAAACKIIQKLDNDYAVYIAAAIALGMRFLYGLCDPEMWTMAQGGDKSDTGTQCEAETFKDKVRFAKFRQLMFDLSTGMAESFGGMSNVPPEAKEQWEGMMSVFAITPGSNYVYPSSSRIYSDAVESDGTADATATENPN